MQKEIEILREKLNKKIEENMLNDDEILQLSQELDLLILKYYKSDSTHKFTEAYLPKNESGSWFIYYADI